MGDYFKSAPTGDSTAAPAAAAAPTAAAAPAADATMEEDLVSQYRIL